MRAGRPRGENSSGPPSDIAQGAFAARAQSENPNAGPIDDTAIIASALAMLDPDAEIARWQRGLRAQHEAAGKPAQTSMRLSYRQAIVGQLISEGHTHAEIAERVGVAELAVRSDVQALRRLLAPKVRRQREVAEPDAVERAA